MLRLGEGEMAPKQKIPPFIKFIVHIHHRCVVQFHNVNAVGVSLIMGYTETLIVMRYESELGIEANSRFFLSAILRVYVQNFICRNV
jgi:hypothetical protein